MASASDSYSFNHNSITVEDIQKIQQALHGLNAKLSDTNGTGKDELQSLVMNMLQKGTGLTVQGYILPERRRQALDAYKSILTLLEGIEIPLAECNPTQRDSVIKKACEQLSGIWCQIKEYFISALGKNKGTEVADNLKECLEKNGVEEAIDSIKTCVTEERQSFVMEITKQDAGLCFFYFVIFCAEMWSTYSLITDAKKQLSSDIDGRYQECEENLRELISTTHKGYKEYLKSGRPSVNFHSLKADYKILNNEINMLASDILKLKANVTTRRNGHVVSTAVSGAGTYNSYRNAKETAEFLPGWWKVIPWAVTGLYGLMTAGHGTAAVCCQQLLGEIEERLEKCKKLQKRMDNAVEQFDKYLDEIKNQLQ